jgi:site-specific DNA-cytosine methylase
MFGDSPARQESWQDITPSTASGINNSGLRGRQPGSAASVVSASLNHHHGRIDSESETFVAYNWQSGGRVQHSFGLPNLQSNQVPAVGVRRLTPTECERLQGFPDGWTDLPQSDTARYRQLGNAVAVPVIEWIGRRLQAVSP